MSAPVVEGAEGFTLDGGPAGVLMLHGFSANPSGLHPFAEALHARGFTVHVPRLSGHGTSWEDLEQARWTDWESEAETALDTLRERTGPVGIVGLSFGAVLALHLAARRPGDVRALIVVNPYLLDRRLLSAPVVRFVRRTVQGVVDDIRHAGPTERGYDRIPVRALVQVARLQARVRVELPRVRQPILAFDSVQDHVIPKGNAALVLRRVGSRDKELVPLDDSYHVAWLDGDAEAIFERTAGFLQANVAAPR
jgi:carboxylesterase